MQVPIYLALVLCIIAGTLWRPAVALGALLCSYGLQQFVAGGSLGVGGLGWNTVTNALLGGAVVLGLLRLMITPKPVLRSPPTVWWVVIALYAFAAISVFWSSDPRSGLSNLIQAGPTIAAFAFLGPALILEPRDLRTALHTVLTVGSLLVVLLLCTAEYRGRAVLLGGLYEGNPLALATLAGDVILVSMLLNFQGLGRFWQVARWVVAALALVMCVRSGSRGQFLGVLLMLLLFVPMSRQIRNWRGFIATAIALLLLGLLCYWAFTNYAESRRWEYEQMQVAWTEGRYETAKVMLTKWAAAGPFRWLIGLGGSESYNVLMGYPHLVPAEVLAEEGLVGLALLGLIGYLSARSVWRLWRILYPHPDARGVLAVISSLVAFNILMSFKSGSLLGHASTIGFILVLGFFDQAVQRWQAATARPAPAAPPPPTLPALAAPLAASAG